MNELWAYERLDGVNRQLDYDVDGIGDYLEDVNGNGIYDSGESDWLNPPTVGQQYSPDTNGVINLRIFTPFN